MTQKRSGRAWFAPEVVQTSSMDCGPASLLTLLRGFGIGASYGRLREACQTSVDGTSIDTLEEVARALGLEAEQVMLPVDWLMLPNADVLPALAVVMLPNGVTHFVVLWRRVGDWVQVMDPGTGRGWLRADTLARELYSHTMPVPTADFRAWAEGDGFSVPFVRTLADAGVRRADAEAMLARALAEPGVAAITTLDAATRSVLQIARAGGLRGGGEVQRAIEALAARVLAGEATLPPDAWTAEPLAGGDLVRLRGAVLVKVSGKLVGEDGQPPPLPGIPELAAALAEPPARPGRALLAMLRQDGIASFSIVALALLLAAGGAAVEAVLFRGMLDVGQRLLPGAQRAAGLATVVAFVASIALLELPIAVALLRLGRGLETRVRIAYHEKLPRLGDAYFHSRLASDMAERGHVLHLIRRVPELGARFLRASAGLLLTTCGIAWLAPASAPMAATLAVLSVVLPLAFQPLFLERDMRLRTHQGALARFYLDALLGLVPIRSHGAERSLRREHEGLLVDWFRAGLSLQRAAVGVDAALAALALGLAGLLLAGYLGARGPAAAMLLLVYWTLQLPALGDEVALAVRQYPALRSVTLRVLELLGAEEESGGHPVRAASPSPDGGGVAIALEGVSARAAGHAVLEGIDIAVRPGEHIAIVGPSGAGKSSLVGLLLGWLTPSAGRILVDGAPLEGAALTALRGRTAWVDPSVQLWNRSLHENLTYGAPDAAPERLGEIMRAADLLGVLERLPEGLRTSLGEGGGLVSGGEGQRVRFGRALGRAAPTARARLVILDEPFRGLDRGQRRALLARARAAWEGATLLCVTHDVRETAAFDRVLVVEGGHIVEDGAPRDLLAREDGRYRALLEAEERVRTAMWGAREFRRWRLEGGRVAEGSDEAAG